MANERVIDSGISVKHAKAWTTSEAIREVYQNWLDVRAEYACKGQLSYDEKRGYVYVSDYGPGLKVEHLAFGNNDKAAGSIGQFGEGLKSAFVALVREGKRMEIRSQGMLIQPFFATSASFGVETLHYKIQPGNEIEGTRIRIWCSKDEAEAAKGYFCALDKNFQWFEQGRISQPGGKLYVNGSKIGDLKDSLFSYHLNGDDAAKAINRDRNAADMNIVKPMIESILNHTKSLKVAEMILRRLTINAAETGDCFENGLRMYSYSDHVWLKAWHRIYTADWVLPSEMAENIAVGYRGYHILHNISHQAEYFLTSFGVKTAHDVVTEVNAKKASVGRIPIKDLDVKERDNLNWAIAVVTKYYSDPGKVVIGTNLNSVTGNVGDTRTIGCRDNEKGLTMLDRTILSTRKELLHTLLHETVHAVSHESDLTSEFEHALLEVSIKIILEENPEPPIVVKKPEARQEWMYCFMCNTSQLFTQVNDGSENDGGWKCPNCEYVRWSCTPIPKEAKDVTESASESDGS